MTESSYRYKISRQRMEERQREEWEDMQRMAQAQREAEERYQQEKAEWQQYMSGSGNDPAPVRQSSQEIEDHQREEWEYMQRMAQAQREDDEKYQHEKAEWQQYMSGGGHHHHQAPARLPRRRNSIWETS